MIFALHDKCGDVLELIGGGRGSRLTTRLDFTVIGPAMNEVSRILSVGSLALHGANRAQVLHTIDPELMQK